MVQEGTACSGSTSVTVRDNVTAVALHVLSACSRDSLFVRRVCSA